MPAEDQLDDEQHEPGDEHGGQVVPLPQDEQSDGDHRGEHACEDAGPDLVVVHAVFLRHSWRRWPANPSMRPRLVAAAMPRLTCRRPGRNAFTSGPVRCGTVKLGGYRCRASTKPYPRPYARALARATAWVSPNAWGTPSPATSGIQRTRTGRAAITRSRRSVPSPDWYGERLPVPSRSSKPSDSSSIRALRA